MDIVYLGHSSFRIKGKNCVVVTDPYDSSKVGLKFPKVDANIVTVSHNHEDHNNFKAVDTSIRASTELGRMSSGQGLRVISNPGEYEIGGVSIFGIPSFHDNKQGEERGKNTIFVFTIDGINLCHLGDLGHKLSDDQIGEIGNVDILFVPVGGVYTINASAASDVVSELEPKVVIPMHYKVPGLRYDLAPVDDFIKELGVEPARDTKFSITPDKFVEDMQVVVLETKK